MPRFSNTEKQIIRGKLLEEGGRLFLQFGLQKVTIDDIVAAVNIAKASFYKFYDNKESLYLDILQQQQKELLEQISQLLENNRNKESKIRVKEAFAMLQKLLTEYPILAMIDKTSVELVARKVSMEQIKGLQTQSHSFISSIKEYGIEFLYEDEIVAGVFHALYQSWIGLQQQEPQVQAAVINIMLDSVIERVVK